MRGSIFSEYLKAGDLYIKLIIQRVLNKTMVLLLEKGIESGSI